MIKQRQFLEKHNKKIEYTFLAILLLSICAGWWYYATGHTYTKANKTVIEMAQDASFSYENFWHKFNTFSVIEINLKDSKHLVSQQEVDKFQNNFFNEFELAKDDTVIEHAGAPVDPDVLFCYMRNYDSNKKDVTDIIKSCNTLPNLVKSPKG